MQKCKPKHQKLISEPQIHIGTIIPVGLLALTLHELIYNYIPWLDSKRSFKDEYDVTVTLKIARNQEKYSFVSRIENMFDALKIFLINDILSERGFIKICPRCQMVFVSERKTYCSNICRNRHNVSENYLKRKVVSNAKTT